MGIVQMSKLKLDDNIPWWSFHAIGEVIEDAHGGKWMIVAIAGFKHVVPCETRDDFIGYPIAVRDWDANKYEHKCHECSIRSLLKRMAIAADGDEDRLSDLFLLTNHLERHGVI
jgi:hypothetical protein